MWSERLGMGQRTLLSLTAQHLKFVLTDEDTSREQIEAFAPIRHLQTVVRTSKGAHPSTKV